MRPIGTALVLASVVLAVLAWIPSPPVSAQSGCFPAGGQTVADAEPAEGDFVVTGRGFGHGAGMSQYGAQGAANLGCDAQAILSTYFPGTTVEAAEMPPAITVGLASDQQVVTVESIVDPVPWELCQPAGPCEPLPPQPGGATWSASVLPTGGYEVREGDVVRWSGGDQRKVLRALLSSGDEHVRVVRLPLTGLRYRWGALQLDSVLGAPPRMVVTLDIPSIDRYLRGVAEVPTLWPAEALRAQAIAARSYAVSRIREYGLRPECRCHVYPTQQDQVYRGYEQELADQPEGRGWIEAVDGTAGHVLRFEGRTVPAYYASSHGGASESGAFVFGIDRPYLRSVDDSRWELASDNPSRTWSVAFSADELGSKLGVGKATRIDLPEPRGVQGRVGDPRRGYGGVRVEGTNGTVAMSGEAFKSVLRLRSTLFQASGPPAPPPPPPG